MQQQRQQVLVAALSRSNHSPHGQVWGYLQRFDGKSPIGLDLLKFSIIFPQM